MLGEKIKTLRKDKGITQEELAKFLNVTRSAVALWEINKTDPDIKNIIGIAKFFNVPTDYIFGLEDESGRKTYDIHHFTNHGNINFK